MKKTISVILAIILSAPLWAQQSDRYEQRYDLLVAKLGPAGVGIETLLDNWEKEDSTNAKMLFGRFSYYFTKAQTASVVSKPTKKYLGMEPVLTLKDSTGNDVYYYQENMFDDEVYGMAVKSLDKAIDAWPDRLDFRFAKANAYIAYEKESPDMALACLMGLVEENASRRPVWRYDGEATDKGFFEDAMQEYCYSFWTIGSPASYEAFRELSESMLAHFPENTGYMNNIGSYYLIAKQDYKNALKWYNKVLKKHPDDYTAIRNCVTLTRKQGNVKQEKKYLQMVVKYGPEKDVMLAKTRLEALSK